MNIAPVVTPAPKLVKPEHERAAKELTQVAGAVPMVLAMHAWTAQLGGVKSLPAAKLVEGLAVEKFGAGIQTVIDGALKAAPELAPRAAALEQARQGVLEWLTQTTADQRPVSLDPATKELDALNNAYFAAGGRVFFETAQLLDPRIEPTPPA